jgi:hypothetical protein
VRYLCSGLPGAAKARWPTDRELHRARLEGRERGIPGWHDAGNWANVERRLAEFPPWTGEVLTIDAVRPLSVNLATVRKYVTG